MRIPVMKAFHWANAWPFDYEENLIKAETLYPCSLGHDNCSIISEGPCIEFVWERQDELGEDTEEIYE